MPSHTEEDWSDTDDEFEAGEDVETAVLLGIPDGTITDSADLEDAAVSRLGGRPNQLLIHDFSVPCLKAFIPRESPSIESAQCKNCSFPMELLVQLWCPFENSTMDRALYVWGCARVECQKKNGSVRAWRGLRFNEKYAKKLEAKLARKKQKEEEKQQAEKARQEGEVARKVNPFSMSTSTTISGPFGGIGTQLFGGTPLDTQKTEPALPSAKDEARTEDHESSSEGEDNDSEEELITAVASKLTLDSPWEAAPEYNPPHYLSTSNEYLPPLPKPKRAPGVEVSEGNVDGKDKDITWAFEGYENSLEVDHVFERFSKRVGYEGEQCVRYELGGTPLPFASDAVFDKLFPKPKEEIITVTKSDFKVSVPPKRTFSPEAIPSCKHCGGKRIFECQLMPHLISVLMPSSTDGVKKQGDQERKKAVEGLLEGSSSEARSMDWGTCMVFSCSNDCCGAEGEVKENSKVVKECWREELVMIQWDS